MENIQDTEPTDAEVLASVLPQALLEMVIKFTFKSHTGTIFGTLDPEIADLSGSLGPVEVDHMWVFDTAEYKWVQIDLADVDSALDLDSAVDGFAEEVD
jgi:hypothetical protein